MPYVTCRNCGLTVYSAARFSSPDHCPGCGNELDRRRHDRSLLDATQHALTRHGPPRQLSRPSRRAPAR